MNPKSAFLPLKHDKNKETNKWTVIFCRYAIFELLNKAVGWQVFISYSLCWQANNNL